MRHPTIRPRSSVTRWRTSLAGLLVVGLAAVGAAAGVAAPAAAEELPALDSTLEIEVTDCAVYFGQGSLHYVVHDVYPAYRDFITITDANDDTVHEAIYTDDTQFEADVALDPGTYTIIYSVERETGGRNIDEQTFTIGSCPDLDVDPPVTTCSTGTDGTATFGFRNLVEGEPFDYLVEGMGVVRFATFTASGPSHTAVTTDLPPGNYYVYVAWHPEVEEGSTAAPPPPMWDWSGFVVEPCQPVITVEVTECTAAGGTGSALVTLSHLLADVEYEAQVTDADGKPYGAHTVTADLDGTARLSVSKLPPGGNFTVSVAGLWTTPPWVEPEFVGSSSNFTPIESVDLVAQADFTVKPCPVALAATGVDGVAALVTGALVLLGLGGAAVFVARRRRMGARDLS